MSTSNHNPDSPKTDFLPAPKRSILRRALPPPGESQPLVPHILIAGDDAGSYFNLRARALRLSGDPADFAGFLSDVLAAQSWEFTRCESMRSAALHLQVEDDRPGVDEDFEVIDDPTRQLLSYRKLSSQPYFRELARDSERYYRRIRQSQESIQKALSRQVRQPPCNPLSHLYGPGLPGPTTGATTPPTTKCPPTGRPTPSTSARASPSPTPIPSSAPSSSRSSAAPSGPSSSPSSAPATSIGPSTSTTAISPAPSTSSPITPPLSVPTPASAPASTTASLAPSATSTATPHPIKMNIAARN